MNESELAFLALGLVLGAAGGAAFLVVLGGRIPGREVRVTVTRDAVPRRSITLATDAFLAGPPGPAPGGPGDRREVERVEPGAGGSGAWPSVGPGRPTPGRAVVAGVAAGDIGRSNRTIVPSPVAGHGAVALQAEPVASPAGAAAPAAGPAFIQMLAGDHGTMLAVVDALAGPDGQSRREWEVLLTGLCQAIAETAADEGILDFPMGNPFWDAFTVEQCREIVASLSSMGHRFDGRDGWVDGRAPAYRELTLALADIGVDPIRVRAWPNSAEIAELLRGARPAAADLVARDAPDLALASVRELTRWHAEDLSDLWLAWEAVRPLLLADAVGSDPGRAPDSAGA